MFTILDTVGKTPLIHIQRLVAAHEATLSVKWERTNPAGSIKDRPAKFIIEEAERTGLLTPGGTIIESSSGNFGISLAMIGAAKGYRVIILVDPKTTPANLAVLNAYGAEVVVVTEQDDSGSYHKTRILQANRMAQQIPGAFRPDQCFNVLNSEAHYWSTAREILEDCNGHVDAVITTVSTGGQLGGLARYFKQYAPHVRMIGVDAVGSAIFGGPAHSYLIPGVGLGWTPHNLDVSLLDYVFKVSDEDTFLTCRALARYEGILAGASSGAAVFAGLKFAQSLGPSARIVCILPDGGERYLQTIYADEWLQRYGLATEVTLDELRDRANQLSVLAAGPNIRGTYQPDLTTLLEVPESTTYFGSLVADREDRCDLQAQVG